ncbi:hypothetical protein [Embleya sp. NPDC005971]|uniref:hypothetical protein n=1 Tax=Embleya sp. NPDC005971 TaxID=3156724 RepID=UPI003408A0E5
MPRIQILELPRVEFADGTYRTPFVLVLDQCDPAAYELEAPHLDAFKRAVGAAAVYATPGTIDIPANDHRPVERDQEEAEPAPEGRVTKAEWDDIMRRHLARITW